jgi:protein involved in temperature-dependent protein secretion
VLFVDSVTLGYAAMEKSKQQQCFDFVTGALLEVNHCPVDALVGSGTYYWIPFSHENRVCIDEKNTKTDHATTRRQTHR